MKKILGIVVLSLLLGASLGTAALARTVYLSDGSVIENAKSAWQSKGNVHVLVNRDTYLTFQPGEVDMKRTFARHGSGHPAKVAQRRNLHAAPVRAAEDKDKTVAATKDLAPATAEKKAAWEKNAAGEKKAAAPVKKAADGAAKAAVKGSATPAATGAVVASKDEAAANEKFNEVLKKNGLPVPTEEQARQLREHKSAAMTPEQADVAAKAMGAKTAAALARGGIGRLLWVYFLQTPMGQITLLMLFIVIASFWKVFEKAGQAGWKSLIPIYNMIVLLQIAGKPIWWLLLFLIPIVQLIFLILMHVELAKRFAKHPLFGVGLTLMPFLFFGILAFDKSSYETPWSRAGGDEGFTFE